MKKLIALVLLLALLGGATAYGLYRRANDPFRGYPGTEQFVDIPSGVGTSGIGRRLVAAGVVSDEVAFRVAVHRPTGLSDFSDILMVTVR